MWSSTHIIIKKIKIKKWKEIKVKTFFFIFLQILPSNKRNWPPEPITVLFGGALDSFTLRVFFRDLLILLSFCPRLTLYRTLDCLDFLCTFSHTNVKPVCSSWFDSVEVWCLHVQIFRGSFWFVFFGSVSSPLISSILLPSFSLFSPPLSSPSPLVLTSSSDSFLTRWREMGLRLNTIITISHMKPIYRVTGTRFQLLGSLTFLHQTAAFCFCLICFYLCVLSEKKKKKPC